MSKSLDIDGFEVFEIIVRSAHVKYVLLELVGPNDQQVVDDIARRNLCQPDSIAATAILDARVDDEGYYARKIVAVCGGEAGVYYCIYHDSYGRHQGFRGRSRRWRPSYCRFIAVLGEESHS